MGALVRYCKTHYEYKWIVSRDASALDFAKQVLYENDFELSDHLQLVYPENVEITFPENSILVVFEHSLNEALQTSKLLNQWKDYGVPVVFGNARNVFFEKPDVSAQGLSYPGMFQLCASYLRGMKQTISQHLAYAEFGVFDGRTCTLAWHLLNETLGHYYAFDSFKGILGKADGEEKFYQTGDYYANQQTFSVNLEICGADLSRFSVVECDFDNVPVLQSKASTINHKLAVVHIDCDVYPAAYNVLNAVTAHLAEGCILLFDDYDSMWGDSSKGEKRALAQWQTENPEWEISEYRRYSATGRAFLCSKR
ncbi:hypothetical protein DXV75_10535 [Alteromonas aestuariivivens]|uniref:Methyltransferase n=1 Tax=Alteromonas aestuariivivens TaxID=1938339 RepID=A0A3D8M626_9ALTE|nr:class I SAM-dependent methyltransferase [Alteromonas aestuariivivens]RDV25058.1 hypothetical protein DXV75_10535 [Alteromonas aestuariivivens]